MVKAELSYNPYLLETRVTFNGQPPKVNSQIEKYQREPLQDWLTRLPKIFCGEMNGYDFDLDFSGTALDFAQVTAALAAAGVTTEAHTDSNGVEHPAMVRPFFKNELAPVAAKEQGLAALLDWLAATPSRQFDYAQFHDQNAELLESPHPFITLWGAGLTSPFAPDDVVVQDAASLGDLPTDLTNTPIVFCVTPEVAPKVLGYLEPLRQKGVLDRQLFFWLQVPEPDKLARAVHDKGIQTPQVVTGLADAQILNFMAVYPRTIWVRDTVKALRKETKVLQQRLARRQATVRGQNRDTQYRIDQLAADLTRLQEADRRFTQRDAVALPAAWDQARQRLVAQIQRWQANKAQLTNADQAVKFAARYQDEVRRAVVSFDQAVAAALAAALTALADRAKADYQLARSGDGFTGPQIAPVSLPALAVPDLQSSFLAEKTVGYAAQPDKLFGLGKLLRGDGAPAPLTPTVTYALAAWRQSAQAAVAPLIAGRLAASGATLRQAEQALVTDYHTHLTQLIAACTADKDRATQHLSTEARQVQDETDWLSTLVDQLSRIERD